MNYNKLKQEIKEIAEIASGVPNQAERLRTCFQYRNHSAHPGEAPIQDAHLIAFFTDITEIVLKNPKLA